MKLKGFTLTYLKINIGRTFLFPIIYKSLGSNKKARLEHNSDYTHLFTGAKTEMIQ